MVQKRLDSINSSETRSGISGLTPAVYSSILCKAGILVQQVEHFIMLIEWVFI